MQSGVGDEALLAGDGGLADGLEFGRLADFVKHGVVVHGGIDTEIALGVGFEQVKSGFFLVEPREEGGAEIPSIGIRKLQKLR